MAKAICCWHPEARKTGIEEEGGWAPAASVAMVTAVEDDGRKLSGGAVEKVPLSSTSAPCRDQSVSA